MAAIEDAGPSRPATVDRHTLLLLGSSLLTYDGDGPSYTELVQQALDRRDPSRGWQCRARTLFQAPSMARRAAALVDEEKPAVVVLYLDATQIGNDSVSFSVRRRWPRLYPLVLRVGRYLDRRSGGGREKTPRRWLFTMPRRLAARLLGMAPELEVDEAIGFVRETIVDLVRNEGRHVFCALPSGWMPKDEERIERYRSLLKEICEAYRVPMFEEALGVRWTPAVAAPDGIHSSLALRQERSELFADIMVRGGGA